jgi:release factor glutamine methyltransferase
MTVAQAQRKAIDALSNSSLEPVRASPSLDASVMLSEMLGIDRSTLLAHPEQVLSPVAEQTFFDAINRRLLGIPVAYITGRKEFWGLQFHVTEQVLIPKPDTELLVELAINRIRERNAETPRAATAPRNANSPRDPLCVLDVCTGSGCVAISIKHSCPYADVTATDISGTAISVAKENSGTLVGGAIAFFQGDLRNGLPPAANGLQYDIVVSNPPYVPTRVARALLDDGRGEPILALDGGDDGLDLVRALVENVWVVLKRGGTLLVETGEYNARAAAAFLSENGFHDIAVHTDLEGQDRVVEGTLA